MFYFNNYTIIQNNTHLNNLILVSYEMCVISLRYK